MYGDLVCAGVTIGDGAQDREVEARLPEFFPHQQLGFPIEHRATPEHPMYDVPLQRAVRVELEDVVGHAPGYGEGADVILVGPAGKEGRRLPVAQRPELQRSRVASVGRAGQHVLHEEANVAAA